METKVKENGAAVNNKAGASKEAAFINNNQVNKEAIKPQEAKAGEMKKDGAQEQPQQPLQPKADKRTPNTRRQRNNPKPNQQKQRLNRRNPH